MVSKKKFIPSQESAVLLGSGVRALSIAPVWARFLSFLIDLTAATPFIYLTFVIYMRLALYSLTLPESLVWYDAIAIVLAESPLGLLGMWTALACTACLVRLTTTALWDRTPGMMLLGLNFRTGALGRPGKLRMTIREIVAFISISALGTGYLWAIFDESWRGWHDKVAGIYICK
jgi:hypothetical protein